VISGPFPTSFVSSFALFAEFKQGKNWAKKGFGIIFGKLNGRFVLIIGTILENWDKLEYYGIKI
jgi:hypothetical protein